MHHSLDLRYKTKQQIILLKWLIQKRRPGAPLSFYKYRPYYLVLLQACDNNTNGGNREETDIGSQKHCPAAMAEKEKIQACGGGRENFIKNQKSGRFRHRKPNDFPSRNGGRVNATGKRRWEENQSEVRRLHTSAAKGL